jgi:single-strand DNA-binding protein
MNKVYLIGNLTRDPELSETSTGVPFCRFSIAVNRAFAGADGNREADFFNITVWRNQAENCGKYLKKGSKIAIVGSLQNRTYDDKEGVRRTVTDIVASEVEFLSSGSARENGGDEFDDVPVKPARSSKPVLTEVEDDDKLPF